jgi:hypothetical protein
MKNTNRFILILIITILSFALGLTGLTGCKKEPITTPIEIDTTQPSLDEEITYITPYILTDLGDTYEDPYPIKFINSTDVNQLYIEDQSIDGIDNLDLFVLNLKDAVYNRDAQMFLSFISEDIRYSFGATNGKTGFTYEWNLENDGENSELWPILDKLLIYGGKLIFADLYQIPYMYSELDLDNYDAVAIGEFINMRQSPDVNSDIIGQINYDKVLITELTDNIYTIDDIEYNWVKVKKTDGTEGYIVNKFIYLIYDYRISISHEKGYWEIDSIISGD